jgi:hypothetical protein
MMFVIIAGPSLNIVFWEQIEQVLTKFWEANEKTNICLRWLALVFLYPKNGMMIPKTHPPNEDFDVEKPPWI